MQKLVHFIKTFVACVLVTRVGAKFVLIYGASLASLGIALVIFIPWAVVALTGFILLRIGLANIVPIFFSEGGRLKDVSSSVAIPAITTMGYAGQLAGPALLGFVAHQFSLPVALGVTGILLLFVSFTWLIKTRSRERG